MRVGSVRTSAPPLTRKSWKPYAETIVKSADPTPTSRCVRRPASRSRSSRSIPIAPPSTAASASRSNASSQLSVGMLCTKSSSCFLLRDGDLLDPLGRELEQVVESRARKRRAFGGRLHLDQRTFAGHDDVHVHFGLRVL